jgi:hypothetical protein
MSFLRNSSSNTWIVYPPHFQNSFLKAINGIVSYSKVLEDIFEIPFGVFPT